MSELLYIIPAICLLALGFTLWQSNWIVKQPAGDDRMQKIAGYVAKGAVSFLKAEYKVLAIFCGLAVIALAVLNAVEGEGNYLIILSFLTGAILSASAGYRGMRIATKANVRTAEAAKTSLARALDISFAGGTVMGISVAALGILGLSVLFLVYLSLYGDPANGGIARVLHVLAGFSLGAESIALFARVGGGIFTKAADVGADLVGKVEAGIPEDDPRNPAVIADNVGDNVGDVAGMGADLFGSYVATVIAAMVLGAGLSTDTTGVFGGLEGVVLPLFLAALGLVFSIAGSFLVKIKENGRVQRALNTGNIGSIVLTAIASYFLITALLPSRFEQGGHVYGPLQVFGAVVVGLAVGALVSLITEYYTSMNRGPVKRIVSQSTTTATNILGGLSTGMISTAAPVFVLAVGIIASFALAGLYGVAIAAAGMMATTGMQLAIDAFGPIADNAGGIAEMSGLPKEVRERTDVLDAVGNTTAAVGKGFAIASAALTSLALFAAFMESAGLVQIDISNAKVLAGLLIGAMIPFLFSALAIAAVGRAANAMVEEVRRQFKTIKGLLEGKPGVEPDYDTCIQISTRAAIRGMIVPGAIAIVIPVVVGFTPGLGAEVLGGLLAGVTVSGVLMAIFQSNAGGAWDNAKKSFEKGVQINGQTYYKGSEPHKAAVVGDTVGDPFKDTSGPSMNILIKLMSIVAVTVATAIASGA
ncbi:MAG: sodium-translocating pyrophosphatase [Bacteroidia bacterium]|nr:sodium-translocating pyrophosphatase [Bacteroidia bacterium]